MCGIVFCMYVPPVVVVFIVGAAVIVAYVVVDVVVHVHVFLFCVVCFSRY